MRALALVLLTLTLPSGLSGQYMARLKGEPVPDLDSLWPFQLEPATPEHLAGLPVPPAPGDQAFAGVLIKHGFRVRGYPTKILLDREGRVVSAGDPGHPPLRGDALFRTVEETLQR